MQHGSRQIDRVGVAALGQFGERRAAGVGQAEQFGGLVESFSGRVVESLAEQFVLSDAGHAHQLAVAAGDQQRDEREGRWRARQQRRQQVAFEVVYRHRRDAERGGQAFGKGGADEQRASQAWPLRIGHGVDLRELAAAVAQYLAQQRNGTSNVVARSEFRDNAAVFAVHQDLRMQRVCEQCGIGVVERHARFVAGRFNSKNQHGRHSTPADVKQNKQTKRLVFCVVFAYNARLNCVLSIFETRIELMPAIRLKENEPFEVAIRRFKRTVEKTGLLTELRAREFYEKPTAERKRKLAAAVKRHHKRMRSQTLPPKLF